MNFEWRRVDALKPYKNNPRKHPPEQIAQIERSIIEFGFIHPILVNSDGLIVAGYGRYKAARNLGHRSIPIIMVEHLSEAEERAYRIADNKIAENATWDDGLLRVELSDLVELESRGETSFDLDVMGFETAELDILLQETREDNDPADSFDMDEAAPVVSRPGAIWELGPHVLVCGSSLDAAPYCALLSGEKAAMVITDPP